MSLYMPEEKLRELPPPGAHMAICAYVVDLGTQETNFGSKRQVYIGWELPDERMSDGKPFMVGRRYTFSSNAKAALRADIESWLGRPLSAADFGQLDLSTLLGMTCTLGIQHQISNDRTYANIASVLRPAKDTPHRLSLSTVGVALNLGDRPFDYGSFDSLPNWLKDLVGKSPEYTAALAEPEPPKFASNGVNRPAPAVVLTAPAAPLREQLDDEIPF